MPRSDTLPLNTHFLVRRVENLGLKQWWVARQVGVSRKTVSRWVNGRVKRIEAESADALASVLDCDVADLTLGDDADVLATRAEQRAAARLIRERNLVSLLSPTDQWQLAEGLIRAAMLPDLPLRDLGALYNLLSTVEWRQGRYPEATRHAARALDIAGRVGDRLMEIKAVFNRATIDSLLGHTTPALAGFERVLAIPEAFDSPGGRASTSSNVGSVYRSLLRFDDAIEAQRAAIETFTRLGADYNLAIAWTSMGVVLAEAGRLGEALDAFDAAVRHARACGYERGVTSSSIYRADVQSLQGRTTEARNLVETHLPDLAGYEVYDLTGHECAARVYRRAGDLARAREQIDEGLRRSEGFLEIRALMAAEWARLEQAAGDDAAATTAIELANGSFREADLPMRMLAAPVPEYGAVHARP